MIERRRKRDERKSSRNRSVLESVIDLNDDASWRPRATTTLRRDGHGGVAMVCRHRWWPVSNWTAAKGPAREERAIPVPIARGAFSLFLSFLAISPLHFGISWPLVPLFRHRHPFRSPVYLPAPFGSHRFPMQMYSPPLRLSFSLIILSRFILLSVSLAPFRRLAERLGPPLSRSLTLSPYGTPMLLCFFVWMLFSRTLLYPFFSSCPSSPYSIPFSFLAASLEPVLFDPPSLSRHAASQWRIQSSLGAGQCQWQAQRIFKPFLC